MTNLSKIFVIDGCVYVSVTVWFSEAKSMTCLFSDSK